MHTWSDPLMSTTVKRVRDIKTPLSQNTFK
jgi:hypothetical protein